MSKPGKSARAHAHHLAVVIQNWRHDSNSNLPMLHSVTRVHPSETHLAGHLQQLVLPEDWCCWNLHKYAGFRVTGLMNTDVGMNCIS